MTLLLQNHFIQFHHKNNLVSIISFQYSRSLLLMTQIVNAYIITQSRILSFIRYSLLARYNDQPSSVFILLAYIQKKIHMNLALLALLRNKTYYSRMTIQVTRFELLILILLKCGIPQKYNKLTIILLNLGNHGLRYGNARHFNIHLI